MKPVDSADTDVADVADGAGYAVTLRMVKGAHSYFARTTDTASPVVSTAVVPGVTACG